MGAIVTTARSLSSGVNAVTGAGATWRLGVSGTWAVGDTWLASLTNALAAQTVQVGAGTVTGLSPTFAFTFDAKMNLLAGSGWYFSGTAQPTVFNSVNALGPGFVELSSTFGAADDLRAMAPYQGGVAVISRRFTQTWSVDPMPENYQRKQTLLNIGTVAGRSVQPVGDMDVYLLADNGVRSLRVRDASNNAIIADIGTPIDEIIQDVLEGLTATQKAAACSVVEPSSNRYWLYLPGNYLYVFSYFPSSGVAAWSRYSPASEHVPASETYGVSVEEGNYAIVFNGLVIGKTYTFRRGPLEKSLPCLFDLGGGSSYANQDVTFVADGVSATVYLTTASAPGNRTCSLMGVFTPEQFAVLNGRVYVRAGDNLLLYGGLNNQVYDRCFPQWDGPFLNAKSPASRKLYNGLDAICEGTWTIALGTNVADETDLSTVYQNTGPSVMRGKSLAAKQGTHFKLRGTESSAGYARFSSAILHYEGGDAK